MCPTVRPSSPFNEDASGKDFKFVLLEKENAPVKKETERLMMTKDTGKHFMSARPALASGNTSPAYTADTHVVTPHLLMSPRLSSCGQC